MADRQYSRPFVPRLIYDVCLLDNDYPIRATFADADGIRRGHRCPVFVIWNALARRCYCPEYKASHPEADGETMSPGWRDSFMAFRRWLLAQPNWEGAYIKLRPGETEYAPYSVRLSPGVDKRSANPEWRSTRLPFPG